MKPLIKAVVLSIWAVPAMADTALLVGNAELRDADRSGGIVAAEAPLQQAGFTVLSTSGANGIALRNIVARLAAMQEDERVVIALTGRFVQTGGMTWFMGAGNRPPDLGTIAGQGFPVPVLLELAARAPGRSLVLLGHDTQMPDPGPGMAAGIGPLEVPEGVSVAAGLPAVLTRFSSRVLPLPGFSLAQLMAGQAGLQVLADGGAPEPFLPGNAPPSAGAEEVAFWLTMRVLDSTFSYQAYLNRYPDGEFSVEARSRLQALLPPPPPPAPVLTPEEAEAALSLTRTQRRAIQTDLTILGYDTRGIDGLFGPGTRGAIRLWQGQAGLVVSGYLDAEQITQLGTEADARRAELVREERDYWRQTGQFGDEAGLRAYLDRYPNGEFSALAQSRLDEIEAERAAAELQRQDRAYWRQTGQSGDEAGLRAYLQRYPNGEFSALARARLAEFDAAREAQDRAYWRQTGQFGDEAGLRAYLDRYPEGLFAEDARRTLRQIEDAREAEDRAYWRRTGQNGTRTGLQAYLDRYPNGVFADEARRALRDLAAAEQERAADNADWARAQGADTIRAYRAYLDAHPNGLHVAQAQTRIAELRAAGEAADRAYWQATGAAGDAAGLRAYLDRYPDGVFADQARAALDAIEEDDADWARAQDRDTIRAYRRYLNAHPDGAHAAQARARIAELRAAGEEPDDAPELTAPDFSVVEVLEIEGMLALLGYDPGPIDGHYDARTEAAAIEFQHAAWVDNPDVVTAHLLRALRSAIRQ